MNILVPAQPAVLSVTIDQGTPVTGFTGFGSGVGAEGLVIGNYGGGGYPVASNTGLLIIYNGTLSAGDRTILYNISQAIFS